MSDELVGLQGSAKAFFPPNWQVAMTQAHQMDIEIGNRHEMITDKLDDVRKSVVELAFLVPHLLEASEGRIHRAGEQQMEKLNKTSELIVDEIREIGDEVKDSADNLSAAQAAFMDAIELEKTNFMASFQSGRTEIETMRKAADLQRLDIDAKQRDLDQRLADFEIIKLQFNSMPWLDRVFKKVK